jgi:hypothetical protein
MEPPPALQESDEQHLLRAVQLAQKARDLGEALWLVVSESGGRYLDGSAQYGSLDTGHQRAPGI